MCFDLNILHLNICHCHVFYSSCVVRVMRPVCKDLENTLEKDTVYITVAFLTSLPKIPSFKKQPKLLGKLKTELHAENLTNNDRPACTQRTSGWLLKHAAKILHLCPLTPLSVLSSGHRIHSSDWMRSSCGHKRAYQNRSSIACGYWAHLLFVKTSWPKGAVSVALPGSHVMIKVLSPNDKQHHHLGRHIIYMHAIILKGCSEVHCCHNPTLSLYKITKHGLSD